MGKITAKTAKERQSKMNINNSAGYFKENGNDADKGSAPGHNQKFTSIKLRWMTAIMSIASGFTPFDKCVAVVIMNAINEKSRDWKLSDETIAALAGRPGAIRSVIRARMRLRAAGWIGWKRTADANVYFLRHENVWDAMDQIMQGKMARKERRRRNRATPTHDTSVTLQTDTSVTQTYSRIYSEEKKSLHVRGDKSKSAIVERKQWSTPQIVEVGVRYLPLWSDSALARMPDTLGYLVRLAECSSSTRH